MNTEKSPGSEPISVEELGRKARERLLAGHGSSKEERETRTMKGDPSQKAKEKLGINEGLGTPEELERKYREKLLAGHGPSIEERQRWLKAGLPGKERKQKLGLEEKQD